MSITLHDDISQLAEATLGKHPDAVVRLPGGANNTVARVDACGGIYLAKHYFSHPDDPRDRLGTEFGMLSFLWSNGVRCIPRPLHMDPVNHFGLYEFIDGVKLPAGEIAAGHVEQLAGLLGRMWELRTEPAAGGLPAASEAKFSIREYLAHVEARLLKLRQALAPSSPAHLFVESSVVPTFDRVSQFVAGCAAAHQLDLDVARPAAERTLSPADHGFHNVLKRADGTLVFLDFEYAGWDTPEQMLANACLLPEVPMPESLRVPFLHAMMRRMGDPAPLKHRLRLHYPLLVFKWALIMLNEFMPVAAHRRAFAGADSEERRALQLGKARRQLELVDSVMRTGSFLEQCL